MSFAAYILLSYIRCIVLSYPAPYWASLAITASFSWAPLYPLSYTAPSELCCTPMSCTCILLSWAITHPTGLHCTLLSYDAACWATLSHPTELCCTLLNYAAPSEQCCTLLSHGAVYRAKLYPLSCAGPYWAKVHHTELHSTLAELRCTLLSFAEPYWATMYPTDLRCSLLSYVAPCMWSTLQPIWATISTITFMQFGQMAECRTVRNKGTPSPVPDWDAGCRNTDAGGISLDADAQLWTQFPKSNST